MFFGTLFLDMLVHIFSKNKGAFIVTLSTAGLRPIGHVSSLDADGGDYLRRFADDRENQGRTIDYDRRGLGRTHLSPALYRQISTIIGKPPK